MLSLRHINGTATVCGAEHDQKRQCGAAGPDTHTNSASARRKQQSGAVDYAANLALFLLAKTGSVFGSFAGRMCAEEQRSLFGRFLGKGTIIINGNDETVRNRVKVCFGMDWDDRSVTAWRDLRYTVGTPPKRKLRVSLSGPIRRASTPA